ncbi:MAG TPA: GPW/gp25 family protein [Hyphomicrobium sp.]|nr:GPW/gp25 family protein [Hyphomicrobium sp.]
MADSIGMDRRTGRVLIDWAHVCQSIADILTTYKLTRVMRRDYGSDNPLLVDKPMTDASLIKFYVATADALDRWEPRFSLDTVFFTAATRDGQTTLRLDGTYLPRGHLGDRTPAAIPDRSVTLLLVDDGWIPAT